MRREPIVLNFSQGVNTKSDPWQLGLGQFLSLVNMVFQTPLLLSKRNGYGILSNTAPTSTYLTTLNDNLIAVGSSISAYSLPTEMWITKGNLQPCSLSVVPLIRNNVNQVQVDSAVSNGLVCVVYTTQYGATTGLQTTYHYAVEDSETGQSIVSPASLPVLTNGAISGSSKVVVVGRFFVIVSPVTISGTTYLQYCSIPTNNTSTISNAQNTYPEAYVPLGTQGGWDACVSDNTLVVAYNTTAGAQGIHVTTLLESQIAANADSGVVKAFANAAYKASVLSCCVDLTANPNIIYISFWNPTTTNGYTCAVYIGFGIITTQFNPQQIISSVAVANLASAAQNGSALVFSEVTNAYSYDSLIPSDFINGVTVSNSGSVGSPYVVIRSVGLASKAFVISGTVYFLSAFQSPFQPSYFLINGSTSHSSSPVIVAKLAYQNGGGYLTLGLPGVSIDDMTAYIAYLFKQDVQALGSQNNTQAIATGGIYSQLGINMTAIEIGTENILSCEIAQDLHLSGGYLSMFDGHYPVEHNFFVFPDSVECTWTASTAVTPTGTWSSGDTVITVSSASGISIGMSITDTSNAYIPAGTVVVYISGTSITISKATTHSAAGDNLSIQGNVAAKPDASTNTNAYYVMWVYEWTDMQGNPFRSQPSIPVAVTTSGSGTAGTITSKVPTLRLTQKIANPVKLVGYRWSVANQAYYQFTSINAPILNDTTIDSISYVDAQPDANIIGNNLIYTTGGIVPDFNAPATNVMTLFDTRLWEISAEDSNVLYVSKTVVEGVPVEMSPVFSIYVAPNIGTTSSTGPMKCIFPMDDKLVLFKKNALYYMTGTGPDNLGTTSPGSPLGSYSQPIFITSVVGCSNQKSIVLTPNGLMFQSDKGIWILNRNLETQYIGASVEAFNSYQVTSAEVVPDTNFVVFTLNTGHMLMYDYYVGQWGVFDAPEAVSSCIFQGRHTLLTSTNQILQETPGEYLDASSPVLMSFTTSWINLASIQGYQRFYEFYLLAKYFSPHKLNLKVAYDYNPSIFHASTIVPTNFSSATASPFGITTPVGSPGTLEQFRVHAKKQLCQSFQITLQEVFDYSFGTVPGAGFSMSGINCQVGIKKAVRPIPGAKSVG